MLLFGAAGAVVLGMLVMTIKPLFAPNHAAVGGAGVQRQLGIGQPTAPGGMPAGFAPSSSPSAQTLQQTSPSAALNTNALAAPPSVVAPTVAAPQNIMASTLPVSGSPALAPSVASNNAMATSMATSTAPVTAPSAPTPTVVDQEIQTLSGRVDKIDGEIQTLSQVVDALKAQLAQGTSVKSVAKKESVNTSTNQRPTREHSDRSDHTALAHYDRSPGETRHNGAGDTVKAPVSTNASGPTLKAVVDGRAWFQTDNGNTITVSIGDSVPVYGQIQSIDSAAGDVHFTSGLIVH
jgi:hypothetical protein